MELFLGVAICKRRTGLETEKRLVRRNNPGPLVGVDTLQELHYVVTTVTPSLAALIM